MDDKLLTDEQIPFPLLCRAWGETELPCAFIANSVEDLRSFIVGEWLGDKNDPTLAEVIEDLRTFKWGSNHICGDDTSMTIEFEIGGVSFERIYAHGGAIEAAAHAPLLERIAELEAALRPFARIDLCSDGVCPVSELASKVLKARAALNSTGAQDEPR